MKNLLICGGGGFIGHNCVEYFANKGGYNITATYFREENYTPVTGVKYVQVDLRDEEQVQYLVQGQNIIVQAAATTTGSKDVIERPYLHVTDNAVMNSLLFREAFEHKVKHVIFFSCTVMLQSVEKPQDEDSYDANLELHPRYYGVGHTKLYIEKMCDFYSRIGETKFTAIRHTNIYGPHDKFDLEKSHVFGATITKVLSSKDGKIHVWGTGEEERDLLYVDDLTKFVESSIINQSKPYELYNCGYGTAISIKELVNKIIEASEKPLEVVHDLSQPTIKTSLSLDCSKAKNELGWKPEITLDQGIAKTIAWWRENIR